jgi:hypothetical protein
METPFGRHILAEYFECECTYLDSETARRDLMLEEASRCGATIVGSIFHHFNRLKEVFPVVRIYLAPIPSYTMVPYSFASCSKTIDPKTGSARLRRIGRGFQARYYNPQIHHAAFALPEHLRKEFEN